MKVTILGCGRWASFHAWYQSTVLHNDVLVCGQASSPHYIGLSATRKNEYLELPAAVSFTSDLKTALQHARYIIISISAQGMPSFSKEIAEQKPKNKTFVLCMKGIIDETGQRLSEVLSAEIGKSNRIVGWVGPGHAQELSKGMPNIMVIDGTDRAAVADVIAKFKSKLIRLYEGDDIIGVEIGAAAKNVLGITAGMLDGAGLTSLKGALMARGVYEVANLIVAMGGSKMTAYGISHLGDFEATLFSQNSHNRAYGENLYKERKRAKASNSPSQGEGVARSAGVVGLAEGIATAKALKLLAKRYNVDMPICDICYRVLYENMDPDKALAELFARGTKKEFRF